MSTRANRSRSRRRRSRVIIPVSPVAILSNVGYYSRDKITQRRRSLDRAMKKYQYKAIISRLNAVAIRFKNTHPMITRNIRSDMLYMKRKYRS